MKHTAFLPDSGGRNYGIDILRIISMYMIVTEHVIGQGGLLVRNPNQLSAYYATWAVETACFCAVNCYGLISGYVGVYSRFRPGRILELWLQVFFYTSLIYLAAMLLHPEWLASASAEKADSLVLKCFLPVSWNTYWYFSCYFVLSFFMPFINRMVKALSERECSILFTVSFLLMCGLTLIPRNYDIDVLTLIGGYSFVWLAVLYVCGACLRRMDFRRLKSRWYILIYAVMIFISWIYKILMENYTRKTLGTAKYGRMLTRYTAPTIFLAAVCLLLALEQVKIKSRAAITAIKWIAAGTFSVYIIHAHPIIWNYVLKGAFKRFLKLPGVQIVPAILWTGLWIFVLCSLMDVVRRGFFKALRIRTFTDFIGNRISALSLKEGHSSREE